MAVANEEIGFDDIATPAQVAEDHPELFNKSGCPKMDYLVRTRKLNGLSDCGAIIEPAARRPMIVKPKFLAWLLARKGE
jgi:hypothetical protein